LPSAARRVLRAMAAGATLKDHRDPEGVKFYQLHPLEGEAESLAWEVIEWLKEQRLIDSNKKFPAATYWLTEAGKTLLENETKPSAPPQQAHQ